MKFNVRTISSNGKFNESSSQGQRKECSQTQRQRWVCCVQGREEALVKWSTAEGGREAEWDEFREVNGNHATQSFRLVNIF